MEENDMTSNGIKTEKTSLHARDGDDGDESCVTPTRSSGDGATEESSWISEIGLHRFSVRTGGEEGERRSSQWEGLVSVLEEYTDRGPAAEVIAGARHGEMRETALHVACGVDGAPRTVVRAILRHAPGTASMGDALGRLPLHVACKFGASEGVIEDLVDAYPEARTVRDGSGRVPLHYLFDRSEESPCRPITPQSMECSAGGTAGKSSPRGLPSRRVVDLVADNASIAMTDEDGNTPLDLFARLTQICSNVDGDDDNAFRHADELLNALLDTDAHVNANEACDRAVVVSAVKYLPRRLRKVALSHPHVRRVLNDIVSRPSFTSILVIDFLMRVLLIILFWEYTVDFYNSLDIRVYFDSNAAESSSFTERDHLVFGLCMYLGALYLAIRELFQVVSSARVRLLHRYLSDLWNWFDVANIALIVASTSLLFRVDNQMPDPVDEATWQNLRVLCMVTGGLQFIVLISYLKATWVHFAVFVSGFLQVLRTLIPFIISSFLLLAAFAYMYWVESQALLYCEYGDRDMYVTFCTMKGSLMWAYSRFVSGGMPEGDFEDPTSTTAQRVLTILFAFLIVILQLNLLIAVVTDAYMGVKERGEEIFWGHRYNYVVEVDAMRGLFCGCSVCHRCSRRYEASSNRWRKLWSDACFNLIRSPVEFSLSKDGCGKHIHVCLRRTFISVGLFFWIVAGMISFGWLWPPQIREWLFCPKVSSKASSSISDEAEATKDASAQMKLLREKIDGMEGILKQMELRNDRSLKEVEQRIDAKIENAVQRIEASIEKCLTKGSATSSSDQST